MTDMGTLRCYRPDPSRLGQSETWRHASASATVTPNSIVVTIAGELDASNAHDLARYVEQHSAATDDLYVDLRDVTFCSTAGVAVLRRIEHQYAQRGSRWRLLSSPAVRKVLRVCGAQNLPQLETLDSAPEPSLV
ncbi:STAS domain-containing protein [Mycolicibacterium arenosum]|uniref:STAS domain-containing protein n=1 Tax=Mycolicibacterium arenosum TaxID=2952157 RepID=A0ABT1M8J7_9MYCO|nr:STAS domain-containing protein [Mycolicibacterium sp. CAU 1645]MCP9274122.1 STAS domain-containing protein [Mycolicibacterium sp. CAU 1645]